ncbi:MAG TPA: cell division protein FtsL [bacterium]|nr:cell division protein FtsL [bacterium]
MATAFTTRQIPTFSAVRHQPVAPKSAAAGRRHIRHVAILVAIGVVFMLAFVWIRIRVIQLGYEVSRIRKETSELKQQKNRLEAEVESLKSPSRLEAIARDRFMMRLPMSDEIVIVGPEGAASSGQDAAANDRASDAKVSND